MRILPLMLLLLAAPAAAQTGVLDQSSPMNNASFNVDAVSLTWQQQVKTGMSGTLEGFVFELYSPAPATVDMKIRLGGAWSGAAPLWSGAINTVGLGAGVWESIFVDCSAAGITLNSGDLLVFELQGTGGGAWMRGNYNAPPGIPYYSEPLYLNQAIHSNGGWRLGFESYMLTGPPTPSLSVTGSCPGLHSAAVSNLTPGGLVAIATSATLAPSAVPNGLQCAGAPLPLTGAAIRVLGVADANGNFSLPATHVGAVGCGLHVIGFDVGSCTASNVVTL